MEIERFANTASLAFAANSTLSPAVDARHFAGGVMHIPDTWGKGTCTFKVAPTSGGNYRPLRDKTGALISLPITAGGVHELHEALMAAHYFRLVSAVTGVGAVTVRFAFKT